MKSPKAVIIGAANLDRHASLFDSHIAGTSNRASIVEMAGGAALNVASRFAACGGEATLVTALGNDAAAGMITTTMNQRGVTLLATPAESTGTYTSLLQPSGELVTAISDMAGVEAFQPTLPQGEFDWTVIDANLSAETVARLAEDVSGKLVLLATSHAKAPRLKSVLGKASLVFGTIAELTALSGDALEPFQWFREQTDATLIASDGVRPLWLLEGADVRNFPIIPSRNVRDVVGAGDALIGTMLFALSTGQSMEAALLLGIDAARRTVEVSGPYLEAE